MSDMSNPPKSERRAVIHRMVMPHHTCPYGLKAVDMLKRSGFDVEDHHLRTREETDAFKAQHGVATTPKSSSMGSVSAATTTFWRFLVSRSAIRRRPATRRWPRCSR